MIKAVFLDFDWTTFSHKTKKIPDSAYKAILQAQDNGVKVFLATGRDVNELKDFDTRNIKFDGYVLDNGLLLLDKDLNVIEVIYMEGKDKEKAIKFYTDKIMPTMIRTRKDGYMNYVDELTIKTYNDVDSVMPPIKEYENEDIMVVTIITKDESEKKQVEEMFKDQTITWWHNNSCDVVPKGCNKMQGISKMIKHFNIQENEIMTVGDSENDTEMIESVEHGVAMGNSVQKIKDVAEYVTDDIDNDGLEKAFKKYNII